MDTRKFFENVYKNGSGRAVIVLPNYQNKPTHDNWFQYPDQLDDMVALAESKATGDVWYSPILFETDSRKIAPGNMVSVAAADADSCDPNNFRVQPTLTIQTSDNHWHVYWSLDQAYDANELAKLNRRISQVHKSQGCDTSYVNAAKLLRVPGTSNNKHPGAIVVVSDYDPDTANSLMMLSAIYPESEVPDAVDVEQTPVPEGLEGYIKANRNQLMLGMPNSIGLKSMLFDKYQEDKRSDVRYKLLCELYRMGLDDKDVVAIAWGAPSNKYNGDDPRGVRGLWAEAMRAKADIAAESGDEYDIPVGGEREVKVQVKPKKQTNFLTAEEHAIAHEVINFIDQWINWASTRTDAPAEYHRAAAIALLSTVYSEFGHATPKFGKLKLNIWMMVLGRSTKDRKSQSRSYLMQALRHLKTDEYSYDLGDDGTAGGITLALHDRANKSSIYSRDEVQGFFKEVMYQSFMSGALEVFTKLYDGWTGGRLRASGEKKVLESVPVSFIMFMMGILTEATEVLTVTNFRSGFLTRFVYVLGRRPDGYESPPLEQAEEDEIGEEDLVFQALMKGLALNRNYWEMHGGEGKTFGLRADEDAWIRFQQYMKDAEAEAAQTVYAEIIGSTTDRMTITTLKLAALLAMDDRSKTIKMIHMLQAISYAGEWFDNAVTVASMVSESEWQRDVDKLEQFINSKGGKCAYTIAYRAFKEKKPFEFEMMLDALTARGTLNRVQQGSRWILEIEYKE